MHWSLHPNIQQKTPRKGQRTFSQVSIHKQKNIKTFAVDKEKRPADVHRWTLGGALRKVRVWVGEDAWLKMMQSEHSGSGDCTCLGRRMCCFILSNDAQNFNLLTWNTQKNFAEVDRRLFSLPWGRGCWARARAVCVVGCGVRGGGYTDIF